MCKHGHRRVVGVERGPAHDVALECVDQRIEQAGRTPDPVGQRRTREFHAVPGVDPRLAIEREMICVLGYEHMREQPGAGSAALDRHGR